MEKTPDADLSREIEMIGFAANGLIELDVEGLTGSNLRGERPRAPLQRNGYSDRS